MSYLIFDLNREFADALAQKYGAPVWTVIPGDALAQIDDHTYAINPVEEGDYLKLLDVLRERGDLPLRHLHLWSRQCGVFAPDQIDRHLQLGFYSALNFTRALMLRTSHLPANRKFQFIYAYLNDAERFAPAFAAVSGFARTVRREQPQLCVKVVGMQSPEITAENLPVATVLEVAEKEWRFETRDDVEVFYQQNLRLVKRLKSLEKEQVSELDIRSLDSPIPVRENGIYLLTGGFGGLGMIFGRYLASQGHVHLVIAGRSSLTLERQQFIEELSALGAKVTSLQVNLSDSKEVSELIARIDAMEGSLCGVINGAGITRDAFLLKKSREDIASVLGPKVFGTAALDFATRHHDLDFFILFSSLAAVLGNVGQADYAYANSFMDVFAQWRAEQCQNGLRKGRSLSMNWPHWADGGMQQGEQAQEWLQKTLGMLPLQTANGIRALGHALQSSVSQVVVLEGDVAKLKRELIGTAENKSSYSSNQQVSVSAPDLITGSALAGAKAYLVASVAKELKLSPESIRGAESLDAYGLDSNAVVRLNQRLEGDVGELSKTLLYEYQTIDDLAGYLATRYAAYFSTPVSVAQGTAARALPIADASAQFDNALLQKQLTPSVEKRGEGRDIAIIGLGGRYPCADDFHELWQNLCEGRDCIREVPTERWDHDRYFNADRDSAGTSYSKWGGFLKDIDAFDPLFFGISPHEAHTIDPQERLFLETAWHTLENAGYSRASVSGQSVGVFAGVMWGQYQLLGVDGIDEGVVPPASSYASIANRVSYTFNLQGPSIAVDTMCSSSITAVHLACQAINAGECDMAIAGGVNLIVHPARYLQLSREQFLSTDGRCRAFGAGGDGYVPGEGVGAVLLKPLRQALADNDRILAVVKASSLNHGGKTNGYRVPNPVAQGELIQQALTSGQMAPESISYIEAHGTGTALGDPIEINGLQRALMNSDKRRSGSVAIGTIKSNIGHLEGAAGIAGLTKVILQMQYGKLVPSIHSAELNANIQFENSGFKIQSALEDWPTSGSPRRAGVSSFGAGGANGHLIIEEAPAYRESRQAPITGPRVVVLSARNEERLHHLANRLLDYLRAAVAGGTHPYFLEDLAYTLQVGRESLSWRLALTVETETQAIQALEQFADNVPHIANLWSGQSSPGSPNVVDNVRFPLDVMTSQRLARAWVAGAEVPWQTLYPGRVLRRIEAPLYPFARNRYWFQAKPVRPSAEPTQTYSHPLLRGPELSASLEKGLVFYAQLEKDLPLFREHSLGPLPVFPGAGYLELALAAAKYVEPNTAFKLVCFTFVEPLFARGVTERLRLRLWKQSSIWFWQAETGEALLPTVHASGQLQARTTCPAEARPLEHLQSECPHLLDAADFYHRLEQNSIGYAPYYRCIQSIHSGQGQALARFQLPETGIDEHAQYNVHPVILDGAFQALASLASGFGDGTRPLQMPFSADQIEILQRPPVKGFIWVREGEAHCQIDVLDEHGNVCLKVKDLVLRPMPDFAEVVAASMASRHHPMPSLFDQVTDSVCGKTIENASVIGRLQQGFESVERYGALRVLALFRAKGVLLADGKAHSHEQLMQRLQVAPGKRRIYEALIYILRTQGWLRSDGEHIATTEDIQSAKLDSELRQLEDFRSHTCKENPELNAHFELLSECADHLPGVLREDTVATDIMFPDSSMHLVEPIYRGNPLADVINRQVVDSVLALVEARIPHLVVGQRISLLEIGAGTGGTSAQLLEALKPYAPYVHYCYTDVSAGFVQYGKKQFGGAHAFVEFKTLDVEKSIRPQGFKPKSYEIVVAANVLHATADMANTLSHAKLLLKENGLLILNEMVRFQVFTTLTFGLLDGWWAFASGHGRIQHSPLLTAAGWQQFLLESGFNRVLPVPGLNRYSSAANTQEAQQVIIAQSDGDVERLLIKEMEAIAAELAVAKPKVRPAPASQSSLKTRIEAAIAETLSRVLELQKEDFDVRLAFQDYGLDSVLGVKLINQLNDALGIDLRTTDIFSYPTPKELIEYIAEQYSAALASSAPQSDEVSSYSESENIAASVVSHSHVQPAIPPSSSRDIAIIGLSAAFPGGENLNAFWTLLSTGGDAVEEIPAARWKLEDWYDPDPNAPRKSISKWGSFLKEADAFDPLFFNLSPREAEYIDPKQRKILEHAWSALEDAGYSDVMLNNTRCGVYIGCRPSDHMINLKDRQMEDNAYAFMGNSESILAARISYALNLKGPAIAIDTACSSSMVAIHLAYESLINGSCDMALAGGVSIMARPDSHVLLSKIGMLSPEGRCRSFDQKANGIVPSEGVGVVVLKPLSAALRDGDPIHAVLKGSGINQDGTSKGITAPNGLAQTALIREVYEHNQIDPETIGLVEAHGTGTNLGDPIEVHALSDAFSHFTKRKQFCAIGSVKSNIGHALAAAGMSSLTKLVLCLKHKQFVPSVHLERENEHIRFSSTPFMTLRESRPWQVESGQRRRGAISSFGFSGTNAHMVLEEAPQARSSDIQHPAYLFPVSARTVKILKQRLTDLCDWLDQQEPSHVNLADISATLHQGRKQHLTRCVAIASSYSELRTELARLAESAAQDEIVTLKDIPDSFRHFADKSAAHAWLTDLQGFSADGATYREKLSVLAQCYLKGEELPWGILYQGCRRLHMPTYPFEKKHFWLGCLDEMDFSEKVDAATLDTVKVAKEMRDARGDSVEVSVGAEVLAEVMYVQQHWLPTPFAEQQQTPKTQTLGDCLVFTNHSRWPDALKQEGVSQRVLVVNTGVNFARNGPYTWSIDPHNLDHYQDLLKALKKEFDVPSKILCFWEGEAPSTADPDVYTTGFAHHLMHAFASVAPKQKSAVIFAHDLNRQSWLTRSEAVSTFGRSLGAVLPGISWTNVGLAKPLDIAATVRMFAQEFNTSSSPEVRYRNAQRYVLRNCELPAISSAGESVDLSGTILISGGAGGLGISFARRLLQRGAKVILLGRSEAGAEVAQHALDNVPSTADYWMYIQADVADESALADGLDAARKRFGPITGVIHAAGMRHDELLPAKSWQRFAQTLAPKVAGSEILSRLTANDPLQFFALFSSTTALLGDHGLGDYALANRFMDSFASVRERQRIAGECSGHTISINWPLWQDGHMQLTSEAAQRFYVDVMGLELLSFDAGWQIFERLLSSTHTRVTPLVGERSKIQRLLSLTLAENESLTKQESLTKDSTSGARPAHSSTAITQSHNNGASKNAGKPSYA